MILPLILTPKCAENPIPGNTAVGRNYIKRLKRHLDRGGFILINKELYNQYKSLSNQKYGEKFMFFIESAMRSNQSRIVTELPNLSLKKIYPASELKPAKFLIINGDEIISWGLENDVDSIEYGKKHKMTISQLMLLEESGISEELDKLRTITLSDYDNVQDFFKIYKWTLDGYKNINWIDSYVATDVVLNREKRSGIENLLVALNKYRKSPIENFNIYTTYDATKSSQELRNRNNIRKTLVTLLKNNSSQFRKATIYIVPHMVDTKTGKRLKIRGYKKNRDGRFKTDEYDEKIPIYRAIGDQKAPHERFISFNSGNNGLYMHLSKGSATLQDSKTHREGTIAKIVNKEIFDSNKDMIENIMKSTNEKNYSIISVDKDGETIDGKKRLWGTRSW